MKLFKKPAVSQLDLEIASQILEQVFEANDMELYFATDNLSHHHVIVYPAASFVNTGIFSHTRPVQSTWI